MKLNNGYKVDIDKEVVESWEFVDLLSEVEENPLKAVKLLKMLLDKEQMDGLVKHLGGKPKASDMFNVLTEIIEKMGSDSKN